jgi:hypothetical protein
VALYIPLVSFVIALVACFLALDYIRRREVAQTKEPAHFSKDNSGRCAAVTLVFSGRSLQRRGNNG